MLKKTFREKRDEDLWKSRQVLALLLVHYTSIVLVCGLTELSVLSTTDQVLYARDCTLELFTSCPCLEEFFFSKKRRYKIVGSSAMKIHRGDLQINRHVNLSKLSKRAISKDFLKTISSKVWFVDTLVSQRISFFFEEFHPAERF